MQTLSRSNSGAVYTGRRCCLSNAIGRLCSTGKINGLLCPGTGVVVLAHFFFPRCFLVGCLVADGAACSFTAALVLDTAFMPACEPVAVGTEVVLRAVWRACVVCRSPSAVPAGPGCKLGAAFLTAGIGLAGACCASCRAGLCCLVSVGTALPAGAAFLPGRGSRVDCGAGAEVGVPAGPCFEPSE